MYPCIQNTGATPRETNGFLGKPFSKSSSDLNHNWVWGCPAYGQFGFALPHCFGKASIIFQPIPDSTWSPIWSRLQDIGSCHCICWRRWVSWPTWCWRSISNWWSSKRFHEAWEWSSIYTTYQYTGIFGLRHVRCCMTKWFCIVLHPNKNKTLPQKYGKKGDKTLNTVIEHSKDLWKFYEI